MGHDRGVRAPLISVALCSYNGSRHLGEQLDSIFGQTWPKIEIVAVDDASTDATWELLQRAAARDARLRIVRNDVNLGLSANFEKCLSLCSGDYIAPADQDDIWQPKKLGALAEAIGSHTLAYCDSSLIDEHGNPLGQRISDRLNMVQGNDPLPFSFWNCISGHAMLFRRDLLDRALPLPAVRFHDWWLAFVAASTGTITYLPEPLVAYRQHAGSQTDVVRRRRHAGVDSRTKDMQRLEWLQALARYPGRHQPLFERMHALAARRRGQWFSPAWYRFLNDHAERLMAINRRESFRRFAAKQFFGMQWRRGSDTAAGQA